MSVCGVPARHKARRLSGVMPDAVTSHGMSLRTRCAASHCPETTVDPLSLGSGRGVDVERPAAACSDTAAPDVAFSDVEFRPASTALLCLLEDEGCGGQQLQRASLPVQPRSSGRRTSTTRRLVPSAPLPTASGRVTRRRSLSHLQTPDNTVAPPPPPAPSQRQPATNSKPGVQPRRANGSTAPWVRQKENQTASARQKEIQASSARQKENQASGRHSLVTAGVGRKRPVPSSGGAGDSNQTTQRVVSGTPATRTRTPRTPATRTRTPRTPAPGTQTPAAGTRTPRTPASGTQTPAAGTRTPRTPAAGTRTLAAGTPSVTGVRVVLEQLDLSRDDPSALLSSSDGCSTPAAVSRCSNQSPAQRTVVSRQLRDYYTNANYRIPAARPLETICEGAMLAAVPSAADARKRHKGAGSTVLRFCRFRECTDKVTKALLRRRHSRALKVLSDKRRRVRFGLNKKSALDGSSARLQGILQRLYEEDEEVELGPTLASTAEHSSCSSVDQTSGSGSSMDATSTTSGMSSPSVSAHSNESDDDASPEQSTGTGLDDVISSRGDADMETTAPVSPPDHGVCDLVLENLEPVLETSSSHASFVTSRTSLSNSFSSPSTTQCVLNSPVTSLTPSHRGSSSRGVLSVSSRAEQTGNLVGQDVVMATPETDGVASATDLIFPAPEGDLHLRLSPGDSSLSQYESPVSVVTESPRQSMPREWGINCRQRRRPRRSSARSSLVPVSPVVSCGGLYQRRYSEMEPDQSLLDLDLLCADVTPQDLSADLLDQAVIMTPEG